MVLMGRMVLIIDDDPAYVKSTEFVLKAHGYRVESARSADEALVKMQLRKPDLVLLDIMMDGVLDGVYVTREMLRQRELQGVPIIIVSSIVDTEYRSLFPQDEYLHFDDWLDKPYAPSELMAMIEHILGRSERKGKTSGERRGSELRPD